MRIRLRPADDSDGFFLEADPGERWRYLMWLPPRWWEDAREPWGMWIAVRVMHTLRFCPPHDENWGDEWTRDVLPNMPPDGWETTSEEVADWIARRCQAELEAPGAPWQGESEKGGE